MNVKNKEEEVFGKMSLIAGVELLESGEIDELIKRGEDGGIIKSYILSGKNIVNKRGGKPANLTSIHEECWEAQKKLAWYDNPDRRNERVLCRVTRELDAKGKEFEINDVALIGKRDKEGKFVGDNGRLFLDATPLTDRSVEEFLLNLKKRRISRKMKEAGKPKMVLLSKQNPSKECSPESIEVIVTQKKDDTSTKKVKQPVANKIKAPFPTSSDTPPDIAIGKSFYFGLGIKMDSVWKDFWKHYYKNGINVSDSIGDVAAGRKLLNDYLKEAKELKKDA